MVVHPVVKETWLMPFHCSLQQMPVLSSDDDTSDDGILSWPFRILQLQGRRIYMNVCWHAWGSSILSCVQNFWSVSNLVQNLPQTHLRFLEIVRFLEKNRKARWGNMRQVIVQVKENEESERWSARKLAICKSQFFWKEHLSKIQE